MREVEFDSLRQKLLEGQNDPLGAIFMEHKEYCLGVIRSKFPQSSSKAEDIYIESLIILRKNIISGKVQKFSSIKSYLTAVCINLARQEKQVFLRSQKKLEDIRLLFYENNHIEAEELDNKNDLIDLTMRAFQSLTKDCQGIIKAYYVHRMSMREIAEVMKLKSSDVAKTKKSRCFKTFKTKVHELRNLT